MGDKSGESRINDEILKVLDSMNHFQPNAAPNKSTISMKELLIELDALYSLGDLRGCEPEAALRSPGRRPGALSPYS